MHANTRKIILAIGLSATALCLAMVARAAPPAANDTIPGARTEPSEKREMPFPAPGIIKTVSVKEGEPVAANQLLMGQDDDIERAELDRLTQEAKSTVRIEYYELDAEVKKHGYERKSTANANSPGVTVFNPSEVEEAKAAYDQAMKQIEVAQLEHAGDVIKAREQELKVKKMQLLSPFDGLVQSIKTHEGELATPDPTKPVIVVVKNDPCNVRFTLTSAEASKLAVGDTLDVQYPGEKEWRQATIKYISPVGESSGTIHSVYAELPNPEKRVTGVAVIVKKPAKIMGDPAVAGQR
jgi:multidrug efflux pump subunit AcrA (membrane-fusion protein)